MEQDSVLTRPDRIWFEIMSEIDKVKVRKKRLGIENELDLLKNKIFKEYKYGPINAENIDLISLDGFPEVRLSPETQKQFKETGILKSGPLINIRRNSRLTSLKGIPREIYGLNVDKCSLTSLENGPMIMHGSLSGGNNQITHLKWIGKDYIRHHYHIINLLDNPITHSVLGLMRVIGLMRVNLNHNDFTHPLANTLYLVDEILNRHLNDEKDILECQEELITSKLKEYAKL
jgi:hypothetical protein